MAPQTQKSGTRLMVLRRLVVASVSVMVASTIALFATPAFAAGQTYIIDGSSGNVSVQGDVTTSCPNADSYGGTFDLLAYNPDSVNHTVQILIAGEVLKSVDVVPYDAEDPDSGKITATYSSGSNPTVNAQVTVDGGPIWNGVLTCTVEADPKPTITPTPTSDPKPTITPTPTITPKPTPDPKPTVTPTPTPDPKPTTAPNPNPDPEPTHTSEPVPNTGGGTGGSSGGTPDDGKTPSVLVPVPLAGDVVMNSPLQAAKPFIIVVLATAMLGGLIGAYGLVRSRRQEG